MENLQKECLFLLFYLMFEEHVACGIIWYQRMGNKQTDPQMLLCYADNKNLVNVICI